MHPNIPVHDPPHSALLRANDETWRAEGEVEEPCPSFLPISPTAQG